MIIKQFSSTFYVTRPVYIISPIGIDFDHCYAMCEAQCVKGKDHESDVHFGAYACSMIAGVSLEALISFAGIFEFSDLKKVFNQSFEIHPIGSFDDDADNPMLESSLSLCQFSRVTSLRACQYP
jgi:hypothetical protein